MPARSMSIGARESRGTARGLLIRSSSDALNIRSESGRIGHIYQVAQLWLGRNQETNEVCVANLVGKRALLLIGLPVALRRSSRVGLDPEGRVRPAFYRSVRGPTRGRRRR